MTHEQDVAVPEAALGAADHMLGDPHATLTLLEYGDCECPACIKAEPLRQGLVDTFGKRLRFVFRHFPWVELHPHAELAASPGAGSIGHACAIHRPRHDPLQRRDGGSDLDAKSPGAIHVALKVR